MTDVRAKKSLGQHFLNDVSVARRIAACIEQDTLIRVLEVGPGMGALTEHLLQNTHYQLIAIEIDRESVDYLQVRFPALKVMHADFLSMDLHQLYGTMPFTVIGNFPYNISSQIFLKILEYRDQIPMVAGMLQKEVAERIAARPGNRTYGITSVLLQAFYDIEYLFTVDRTAFTPPPKVQSAVIRLRRNTVQQLSCDERLFVRVVKTAFGQRRKTLRNSLKSLVGDVPLPEHFVRQRPEQLSVAQFIELTNLLAAAG